MIRRSCGKSTPRCLWQNPFSGFDGGDLGDDYSIKLSFKLTESRCFDDSKTIMGEFDSVWYFQK